MGYGLIDAHRAVLKAAFHKVYGDTALTLCDTSRHVYTVRAPHNANIDSVSFFWTCSDNLQMVAGQNTDSVWVKCTNGGAAQLHCHIIHDGDTVTSSIEIPIVADYPVYDNISINGSISYPDTFVLSREIVVDSLAGLTWQNKTVLCTPDCQIIIRPGGFMTVNHTTLTSACPNRMWQGIEVTGNSDKRQVLHNQGCFLMGNGSVIENAFTAVRNCLATDSNYVTTGGVIYADSSFFVNNGRAVQINSYAYSSQPGLVSDYISSFHRCMFTVNDQNLFTVNDTVFTEHVRLWDVKGLSFKGCRFADSMSVHTVGSRGIYAEDAGLALDTYCGTDYVGGCKCPENHADSCFFFGFTTAVEVNTTGNPYSVTLNQVQFSNNGTGVRINGNNHVTVTRNTFDLQSAPYAVNNTGLRLEACTGYKVEANVFGKAIYSPQQLISTGIYVNNSGNLPNLLHLNSFSNLNYGIKATGNNGGFIGGLLFTCNDFSKCGIDFYVGAGATVASNIGSPSLGADNVFRYTRNSSLYNAGVQSINYYYSSGLNHTPYNPVNITVVTAKKDNSCASTLCNDGGTSRSLSGFQSDMNAYTTALEESGNNDNQDNNNSPISPIPLADMRQSLSEDYYEAVLALMSDSVLDLDALEQWHTAAQPIADPYSLVETRFMEGYAEIFAQNAETDAETANYAEFHAMKLALRGDNNDNAENNDNVDNQDNNNSQNSPKINWYALTPAQIAQLQTIAERNTGRSSVMAKGVLCFFFGICYDDEWGNEGVFDTPLRDDDTTSTRAKRAAMDITDDAALSVYPNPTDNLLYIELPDGAGIANVALFDLQGRIVGANNYSPLQGGTGTLNVKNVPAGVYLLCVTDADGKEYRRKIVRK